MAENEGIEPPSLLQPAVFKRPRPKGASWGQEDGVLEPTGHFPFKTSLGIEPRTDGLQPSFMPSETRS
jgi:hypothetical protein